MTKKKTMSLKCFHPQYPISIPEQLDSFIDLNNFKWPVLTSTSYKSKGKNVSWKICMHLLMIFLKNMGTYK